MAFLVSCMMLVSFAAPAHASSARIKPSYELTEQQTTDLNGLTSATEQYGSEEFDADKARSAGVSEASIADYARVLESAGWSVQGKVDLTQATSASTAAVDALSRCKGRSGYTGFWFPIGHQFAMNSCQTSQFIALLGLVVAGGAIGGLASFLSVLGAPVGAVSTIIAAFAGIGVGFAQVCQAYSSNGAIYVNSGGPPVFPPSCWGQ